jgi:hypothetical protein
VSVHLNVVDDDNNVIGSILIVTLNRNMRGCMMFMMELKILPWMNRKFTTSVRKSHFWKNMICSSRSY